VRDDRGYWQQLEAYLGEFTGARISPGLCQECFKQIAAADKQETL
jgi:hypothetical protein